MVTHSSTDIVERLRNPMWAHGNIPFESPQLEQEENLTAMREAADEIERLRASITTASGEAATPSTAPICCYCDANLSCARCGREQPNGTK